MAPIENVQIAARLRGLLANQGDFSSLAVRLHVHETSLRMSVDELSPYPTVEVIAAVIKEFAVDPHWLMTGDYDSALHRVAIEAHTAEIPAVVRDIVLRNGSTPPHNLRIRS